MTEGPHSAKKAGDPPGNPPDLVPPDAKGTEEKKSSRTPLLVLAGGLLLIIAALLVLFLPLLQEDPTTAHQVEPQDTRPTIPAVPPTQSQGVAIQTATNENSAEEIEQLFGVWLQKQAEAEAVNVTAWGGDSYTEAVSMAQECDQLFGKKKYLPAKDSCEEAIRGLDDLMASKEVLLEEAVAAGLLAIEHGNPEVAVNHFQRALAIDANEERASVGIRRAEQLPAVLQFLNDGLAMESAGDPDGALLALSEATTLDPDYAPAEEALARVRATISEREFQQAMSRALQAATEGKLSTAKSALKKAEAIKPGDHAVRDLRQQIAQRQLAARLASLQQDSVRMEKEERWKEALKSCEEALILDPHAAFAASCKERVSMRIDLDSRLKAILAKPERLFEDGPLQEARQTLAHASGTTPRGSVLTSQIDQVDRLITQAEAEVEVMIISDGLTDVTIYHVGRLGVFQEKRLVLRTGNYVATGNRNGFRDVRQTLKVRPASGKMVFTLRCEEPI
jgi:tetratricopeptide (TPR) repeat protein